MNKKDYKHANELGEIEAFKHTKYWFKRDIQTIKKGAKSTFQFSSLIFFLSFLFSVIMNYSYKVPLSIWLITIYTIAFFPIFALGFFLVYVIVKKGYDSSSEGTVIDQSRNPFPKKSNK